MINLKDLDVLSSDNNEYIVEYKGVKYQFNPAAFGVGMWYFHKDMKKGNRVAPRDIQLALNKLVFNLDKPPSLKDLMRKSSLERSQSMKDSTKWLKKQLQNLISQANDTNKYNILDKRTYQDDFSVGDMYFFFYDAKYKDILPHWDMFPLTVLFGKYNDGFIGLNLHYVPPQVRVYLFEDMLQHLMVNGENASLAIDHDKLFNSGIYSLYKPCIKRYLLSHVQSKVIKVEYPDWVNALWLPVERFVVGKNSSIHTSQVWKHHKY